MRTSVFSASILQMPQRPIPPTTGNHSQIISSDHVYALLQQEVTVQSDGGQRLSAGQWHHTVRTLVNDPTLRSGSAYATLRNECGVRISSPPERSSTKSTGRKLTSIHTAWEYWCLPSIARAKTRDHRRVRRGELVWTYEPARKAALMGVGGGPKGHRLQHRQSPILLQLRR
jgi:hypothetical protein